MFLAQSDIISFIINEDFCYLSLERQQEIFREIRKRLISYYKNGGDNFISNLNIDNQKNTKFTVETSLLLIVILESYGQEFLKKWVLGKMLSEDHKNEWMEKAGDILNEISSKEWRIMDDIDKNEDIEKKRKQFISEILLLEKQGNYIFSKVANTIFNLTLGKFESAEINSVKNQLEEMVRLFGHLTEEGQIEFIRKKRLALQR